MYNIDNTHISMHFVQSISSHKYVYTVYNIIIYIYIYPTTQSLTILFLCILVGHPRMLPTFTKALNISASCRASSWEATCAGAKKTASWPG